MAMLDDITGSDPGQELVHVIRRVRNRWRLKLAIRGLVLVVAGTLLALFLSASGLEALRFSTPAIVTFRIAVLFVFAGLVYLALVRPLMRRVTDGQVALYLEERDPSLQAAILSAVEGSTTAGAGPTGDGPSPKLVERLVEQAVDQCHALDDGVAIDQQNLRRQAVTLIAVAAAAALLVSIGPAFLRHGLSALLVVTRSADESSPYAIRVQPGDTRVPRGSDQTVSAQLTGFSSTEATLMMRADSGDPFERVPLVPGAAADAFEVMLFHIDAAMEYYIESNGVYSPTFTMAVLDLPTVDRLVLEYHFPEYTGLEPRTVDPGGDIAVIHGTEVRMRITPTMTTPGGRVRLDDEGGELPLEIQTDGTLVGAFTVERQGYYQIELDGPQGEKIAASPQYTIDVLVDQTPSVSFSKPGRDTNATAVEEVFAEVRADDDFGVQRVQMFYSVNGGEETSIQLFGGGTALPEVTASHTLYLEELGLGPGDFVSYYARATDNDGAKGPKTTTSDIYFVQVRPFRTDFRAAQSMAGMGGGGAGQQMGQLSQQQRQIVAATFNVVRDRDTMSADEFRETTVFLTLSQSRLREQVEELSEQMNSRLDVVDPAFKTIAEALPKAAAEMETAEGDLRALRAKDALSPEQRALKLLQDAEQQYELQVAQSQGGGGAGGGGGQMANDLADLFELELDKLANQYEMQARAEMQSADMQVDELAERLKELARRQQQEAERQRRLAAQGNGTGSSGDLQRQLAQEVEEAARRLEQLQREQQRQDLREAARQLQEAANAMRQAAANGSRDGGAQAQAALDRLREAQQRLERNQGERAERDAENALRQAERLAEEQRELAGDVGALDEMSGADRQARAQTLAERKNAMDADVADLQDQLEKIANEARRDDRAAARELDQAAGSITDNRIREKIRYTRNTLANPNEYARAMETDIGANLEELAGQIKEAQAAFGEATQEDALERAVDQTREMVRGLESLNQRMQDRAQQGQQGQQGQDGQQGQQGQQGQDGQQGQQGQQGQSGQQATGGGSNDGGPASGGSRAGDARAGAGGYSPDDIRQFRRELTEWQTEGQALRRQLADAGVDSRELDDILRDLDRLNDEQNFVDPRNLADLQAAALEQLKNFEFSLRMEAEGGNQPLSLSPSDEVPAEFRTQIEEYYRSLSRASGR